CAGALAWGALQWPRISLAEFHSAGVVVGDWLDRAPPGGQAITSYFQTIFAVWYLRTVEERRPDIFVIHRHFLSYPGYREELVAREPSRLLGEKDVTTSDGDALIEYDLDLAAPLVER